MAECRLLVNVYWLQGKKKAPAERPTVLIAMAERYAISNVKTLMKSCFSMVMYIIICMSRSRVDHDTNASKKKNVCLACLHDKDFERHTHTERFCVEIAAYFRLTSCWLFDGLHIRI